MCTRSIPSGAQSARSGTSSGRGGSSPTRPTPASRWGASWAINTVFRTIKAATPGSYTFILPATKEVPRRLLHPKKKTVGVRIPQHTVAQALLAELGEPLLSSTLLLPDEPEPLTQGWEIKERLDNALDAVLDSGDCGTEPTTVVDFSGPEPEIVRRGAGDPARFE
jgi:tRNA threonylcarbamoyl adenosine modification protein (Sua5/YciO/YrdC/YwlC family)